MDAFGAVIQQYYDHGGASEVLERNDGYVALGDLSRYFAPYEEWEDIEQSLIARVAGRVLDIGCGAGRHSLYLEERGTEVLAIDSSAGCIDVAARRGVSNTQVLLVEHIGEVRDPPYDTILLLGNNLGLLGSKAKARRILAALDQITSPSAQILGTTSDYIQTSDPAHLAYHEYNRKRRRLPGTIRVRIRWHEYVGEWFEYVLFTEKDLGATLKGTPWKIEEILTGSNEVHKGYIIGKSANS